VVLGFPIPSLLGEYHPAALAAAAFGEGMSSPLLDRIRERRGLVYHADCSADVTDLCGPFVIEASTMPEHLDEFFIEVTRLLREHAEAAGPVSLERARNQVVVRTLTAHEDPAQRLEVAALDLFAFGRIRSSEELIARFMAVTCAQVREALSRMLGAGAAVALAGKVAKGAKERVAERMAGAALLERS